MYEAWDRILGGITPALYPAADEQFILISRGEAAQTVADYWTSTSAGPAKPSFEPMPYYLDPDGSAFGKFADSYVPRIYLVGADGKVKHMEIETFGFADGDGLVRLIDELNR